MPSLLARRQLVIVVLSVVTLVAAGCGGAESRKARHMAKGHTFLEKGNIEKARVEFRNALQITPNDSEVRYENGVADEKLGNVREAAQFYQGAIDTNPDNVGARASLGRLFVLSGAADRALEAVKPSLEKHPDDAALLTVRAAARAQLKDTDGALKDAERAVQLAPNSEDAIATLAGVYKLTGQPDKSRALLEGAVKRLPQTVDLRLALAQLYASQGQEPQVEALLIDLVRLKPNESAHRLRLAQYYARLNHIDEAERVLREAIKALPDDHNLKLDLLQFLAARRGRDVADKELTAMIAANPKDYSLKFAQANFYEQGKQIDKAEAIYRQVIADTDLDAPGLTARNRLAVLLVQNNDSVGAEKLLAEVLAKSPRDNDALILRGNLALAQQDPKSAITDLRAVLRDQPNAVGVMRSLARAHLANDEPALAEETMRRAVDANPKDTGSRLDLAQLLLQLGKPEEAKPVVDDLVKQDPNNMRALDAQFHVAAATKDGAGAKAAAAAMVALQPKASIGYYYEASIAESEKRPADALRLYSTALDLQPEAAEPLQGLARVLVAVKGSAAAIQRLDEVAASYPKLPFALNIKGELLTAMGRTADAKAAFGAAIERVPKWRIPYQSLARAQAANKDLAGAAATLQAGILKADSSDPLQTDLGLLFERMGKPDEAMQMYDAALHKNPRADVAANNLAMLLVTYKKDRPSLDRAKDLAQRFANSSNATFLDTYGWMLYKRGESAAAVAALQTVVSKAPDAPASLYHLGMAQASAGLPDAARDSLSRSLNSGKPFPGMDEAKAELNNLAKLAAASPAPKS
jgi:tetratricopeptide (TPR) repeat protein